MNTSSVVTTRYYTPPEAVAGSSASTVSWFEDTSRGFNVVAACLHRGMSSALGGGRSVLLGCEYAQEGAWKAWTV
jgi:hypothetical protein